MWDYSQQGTYAEQLSRCAHGLRGWYVIVTPAQVTALVLGAHAQQLKGVFRSNTRLQYSNQCTAAIFSNCVKLANSTACKLICEPVGHEMHQFTHMLPHEINVSGNMRKPQTQPQVLYSGGLQKFGLCSVSSAILPGGGSAPAPQISDYSNISPQSPFSFKPRYPNQKPLCLRIYAPWTRM